MSLSSNYLLAFKYKLYISGTPVGTGSSRGLYKKATISPRLDMVGNVKVGEFWNMDVIGLG
jgi:hypothetical protein